MLFLGIFYSQCLATITTTEEVFENGFLGKTTDSGGVLLNDYFDASRVDLTDSTITNKGILQIRTIVKNIVKNVKNWLIPIAIIFITYGGFSIILTRKDDQAVKTQVDQLLSIGVGFAIIALSIVAIDSVFFGKQGEVLTSGETATSFAKFGFQEVSGLFDFVLTFAVAIAILFLILNAYKLILGSDDENTLSDVKKKIVYSIVGIIILLSSKKIVALITSNGQIQMPNIDNSIGFVATWINKILGLLVILAFSSIVWAGLRLVGHFADEGAVEESKKIVVAAIMGLAVAFSAWVIIYYFTSASLG